jgi:hypothetical protein
VVRLKEVQLVPRRRGGADVDGTAWTHSTDLAAFAQTQHGTVLQKARYIDVLRDPDPVGRLLDYVLAHGAFIHPAPDGNRLRVPGGMMGAPVLGRQLRRYAGALMARAMGREPTPCATAPSAEGAKAGDCPRPAPWPRWAVTEGHLMTATWKEQA